MQALALIDLLRAAQEEKSLSVPWAGLGKASFRALVVSPAAHDKVSPSNRPDEARRGSVETHFRAFLDAPAPRDPPRQVKKLLDEVISAAAKAGKAAVAEDLAARLAADCCGFFSAGDRYACLDAGLIAHLQARQPTHDMHCCFCLRW